jgi:hypothetical protein
LRAAKGVARLFFAPDLPGVVGWKASENAIVVSNGAPVDLANPGPDASVRIPLMIKITFRGLN